MREAELVILIGVVLLEVEATYTATQPWADVGVKHPGCQERCGNVSIPYPFGTTPECYYNKFFLITCNNTFHPPKPFLRKRSIDVTDISIEGKLHVMQFIARDCYDVYGGQVANNRPSLTLAAFTISDTDNKFVAVGCDTEASVEGYQGNKSYTTGCISKCDNIDYVINYSCSGIGCCQTSIPKDLSSFEITVGSYNRHLHVWNFSPCSYAFVVEQSYFNFSSRYLSHLQDIEKLSVVLEWSIGSESCEEVQQKNIDILKFITRIKLLSLVEKGSIS